MEYLSKFRYFRKISTMVRMERCNQVVHRSQYLLTRTTLGSESRQLFIHPHVNNQVRSYAKKDQGKMARGGVKMKVVNLSDEELSEVIDVEQFKNELLFVKEKLIKDFVENLTLRSSASQIDSITVKVQGDEYPLHELAQISKKNPNFIAINMAEFPEALKPTIQAIIDSGSGLNPQQDGTMIYLSVPKLTREHRENLAKNAKSLFMKAKEKIRNVQNNFLREAKKQTDLSEDLVFNATNQILAMADQTSAELEKITKVKQKELLGDG